MSFFTIQSGEEKAPLPHACVCVYTRNARVEFGAGGRT
jgi:hypothetical protein